MLLSFVLGFVIPYNLMDSKVCPEVKEAKSYEEQYAKYYEHAMRNCSRDHTDYECMHFIAGGSWPKPSPSPEPTEKPKAYHTDDY